MSPATALAHDAFAPRRPPGMRWGLVLAVLVHVLLVLALAWGVSWKTSQPEGVAAELWSAVPQFAAPKPVVVTPPPPVVQPTPPRPVTPPPVVQPAPPPPRVDAQIAIEKAKQEAARREAAREEAAREDAARRAADAAKREAEQQRKADAERQRLADEKAEKQRQAEKAKQEQARLDAIRAATLKRMMAQAGTSDDPNSTGTAARTSGPSASWAGRVKARIKPNIVLTGDVPGNPLASVEVRLAPDGTIVGRKLVKSSGSALWDDSVLRAIDRTQVLPRDVDGRVPSSVTIDFRPQE